MTRTSDWEHANKVLTKVRATANLAKLLYVLCFWYSPFGDLNHRVGYFESYCEASGFADQLKECYADKYQLPYRIYSSVDRCDNVGNLEF